MGLPCAIMCSHGTSIDDNALYRRVQLWLRCVGAGRELFKVSVSTFHPDKGCHAAWITSRMWEVCTKRRWTAPFYTPNPVTMHCHVHFL